MNEDIYSPSCPEEDFDPCSPEILDQHKRIKKEIAAEILNSVPNPVFILNSDRRIILYNANLSDAAGGKTEQQGSWTPSR